MIKSWKIVYVGHAANMWQMSNLYNIFVGESKRKRPYFGDSNPDASINRRTISRIVVMWECGLASEGYG
jgi:hypothetical protein